MRIVRKMITKKGLTEYKATQLRIVLVSVAVCFLFGVMSYYIFDYSVKNKQELIGNSYNKRQRILSERIVRGTIYSKDKDVLVSSELNENNDEVRTYHYGSMFSHALGYALNGRMGVEKAANYYLINSSASVSLKSQYAAAGKKYPGDSVYTTFDLNLQKVAYEAMGQYKGAVIVTEPSTGKILAMVSKPDFDPALISVNWDFYRNDTDNAVLLNRALFGKYPPGSTFKIITALEYMREYPDSLKNYSFVCEGYYSNGDDRINCYHKNVHGKVDFLKSFAKSCNSSFANIGLSLDKDKFGKTLNQLLFNEPLPSVLVDNEEDMIVNRKTEDSDMIQLVIGQGQASISPLHLNMITSAIANNGVLMKPYDIEKIESFDGKTVKYYKPQEYGNLMSENEATLMGILLEDVVKEGTAKKLQSDEYTAAGKTGSAEIGTADKDSHAWFTGYAYQTKNITDGSAETPPPKDICVTVIIEKAGSGGEYAVPVAKRIFDAYYNAK